LEKNAESAKKVTVVEWVCEACTIINQPGGLTCTMCSFAAPASAFVDLQAEKAAKEAEEKKKKEEEERIAREQQIEEERKRQEELKRLEEERQ
jgi:hypothetical protein